MHRGRAHLDEHIASTGQRYPDLGRREHRGRAVAVLDDGPHRRHPEPDSPPAPGAPRHSARSVFDSHRSLLTSELRLSLARTPYVVQRTMRVRCTIVKPFEGARRPVSAREEGQVASDAGLSKQRVVVEAVRLADREGVDGLSMRRLAGALGAGAMSLYHYVASKDELLDAMIDIVFEEIELPPEETDWQSAMRRRSVSARQVLARHPWAIGLMESRTSPGPANLRHREAVTACLRRAGFSV